MILEQSISFNSPGAIKKLQYLLMGKAPWWLMPLLTGQTLLSGHCTVEAALLLVTMLLDEAFFYKSCLELEARVTNCPELASTEVSPQMQTWVLKSQQSQATVSSCLCSAWHLSARGVYVARVGGEISSPAHLWASVSVFIAPTADLTWWHLWSLFSAATAHRDSALVSSALSLNDKVTP